MAIQTPIEVIRKLTPDDVERMLDSGEIDSERRFELVNGEIVDLPPAKPDHGYWEANVVALLHTFARLHGGGVFGGSAGFKVGRDRLQLRAPDASYVAPEHFRGPTHHFGEDAPDLAVEVLSDDQFGNAYAISKASEYFDAGATLVWFVNGHDRTVRVHCAGSNEIQLLHEDHTITLEPIISGFAVQVAEFFR
ncbi:MAG TPA: Uma2 family endonuclease [Chloroflexota bacterium]|nr:Uma2 family endonuclease [Chloroflexota bacterium]